MNDNIHHCLGEIRGELRAIIRQNATIVESQKNTQSLVQSISTNVAEIKATQKYHGEELSKLGGRVGKLEERADKQDVTIAKHAAGIAAAASIGMALIIEGFKQWWMGK
ncbi:MAG: hypothetical protein FWC38_00530 [Proteobacteria bacterium]|nr:hypothetical protein [Pseudomonadota bacterium]